jgi:Uncharacterized conserved protein
MKVYIPYGSGNLDMQIPDENLQGVYSPNDIGNVKDCNSCFEEIEKAIDNPIGCPQLKDILFKGCTVNIICDDITRPTPVKQILEVLIPKFVSYGANKRNIKIIMALGSHRHMTKEEMIKKVGPDIYREFPVLNSEFKDKSKLVNLGKASDGVEILANKDRYENPKVSVVTHGGELYLYN